MNQPSHSFDIPPAGARARATARRVIAPIHNVHPGSLAAVERLATALDRAFLKPLPIVRVAVQAGDVTKPEALRSLDKTLAAFTRTCSVGRYADPLAG